MLGPVEVCPNAYVFPGPRAHCWHDYPGGGSVCCFCGMVTGPQHGVYAPPQVAVPPPDAHKPVTFTHDPDATPPPE